MLLDACLHACVCARHSLPLTSHTFHTYTQTKQQPDAAPGTTRACGLYAVLDGHGGARAADYGAQASVLWLMLCWGVGVRVCVVHYTSRVS